MYISCTYNALALLAWKILHHTGEVCGFGKKTKMYADLVIKICNCAEMVKNRTINGAATQNSVHVVWSRVTQRNPPKKSPLAMHPSACGSTCG